MSKHFLFVVAKDGEIVCLPVTELGALHDLVSKGWKHTATIEPASWIESIMSASPEKASDMMDELNFG
jgi:hypothetical protein